MIYAILKALTWVALKGRVYYIWSKVYQWIWERKYKHTPIPTMTDLKSLEDFVGRMEWRKDTWVMLWDAISNPRATLHRHSMSKPAGDCDDISLVAAILLEDMADRRVIGREVWEVGLLSCPWYHKKAGGHNVCVFRYQEGEKVLWAHMSNWHNGKIQWGYESLRDVVRIVVGGKRSLGWAYATTSLKLKLYGGSL